MLMHSFSTRENMLNYENKGKLVDLCDYSNVSHFQLLMFQDSRTFQNLLNVNHKAILKPQRSPWISDIGLYRPNNYYFGSIFVEFKEQFGVKFCVIFPRKWKIST